LGVVSVAVLLSMPGTAADAAGRTEPVLRIERYVLSMLDKDILIEKFSGLFSWMRRPSTPVGNFGPSRELQEKSPSIADLTKAIAIKESKAAVVARDPSGPISKVSSLYEGAETVFDDTNVRVLTQEQIETMINAKLNENFKKLASKPDSGIEFDVLTGRLKLRLRYGPFTADEVNLYKITGIIGVGILACKKLDNFRECANATLATVNDTVAKELNLGPANTVAAE
jgi:hypothetical protein